MGKFFEYVEKLPVLFKQLIESPIYKIDTLTEGRIKEILRKNLPVKGVYLMYDRGVPMYVSRSKTLAQKIRTDEVLRAMLVIYVLTELQTPFNSFMET